MSDAPGGCGDRIWTVDEANAALARVAGIVERVQRALEAARADVEDVHEHARGNGHSTGGPANTVLRNALDELSAEGIVLRDPDRGLIDFPARAPSGRTYLLCWLAGEPAVEWWHWPEDGFAGRTPLTEPPE